MERLPIGHKKKKKSHKKAQVVGDWWLESASLAGSLFKTFLLEGLEEKIDFFLKKIPICNTSVFVSTFVKHTTGSSTSEKRVDNWKGSETETRAVAEGFKPVHVRCIDLTWFFLLFFFYEFELTRPFNTREFWNNAQPSIIKHYFYLSFVICFL